MKYFTRHLLLIILNVVLFGSSIELPIGLTENEKQRKDEIYSMGRDTDPPPHPVRNTAEF